MSKNNYVCIITGVSKYLPPSIAEKKIEKFGSIKEFRKHYISPSAAKLLRAGEAIADVREALGGTELPDVDPHILTKLNLLRKKKGLRALEAEEKQRRDAYLRSKEYREKIDQIKIDRDNWSDRQYIEYATGGPDRCQTELGGTCARPDIYLSWNIKACDGCNYYEHCLCANKRLSHEKKKRKRK